MFRKDKLQDNYNKLEMGFSEMKSYFNYLSDANDVLDRKFLSLLSSISIIITFFGIFALDGISSFPCYFILLLFLIILLFFGFIVLVALGLFPKSVPFPFDGTYKGIENVFENKPTKVDAIKQIIVNYEANIFKLKNVNKKKTIYLKLSYVLFAIIVILIAVSNFIPID
jgi:hypothetical protein